MMHLVFEPNCTC